MEAEFEVDYPEEEAMPVRDHKACWDLHQRGAMGETALHLLVLADSPATIDIAKIMLDRFPALALDYYEGEEYYGMCLCVLINP